MSQTDIYNYLQKQRRDGNEGYFTPEDISKVLNISVKTARIQINKLRWFNYLDCMRGLNNDMFVRAKLIKAYNKK